MINKTLRFLIPFTPILLLVALIAVPGAVHAQNLVPEELSHNSDIIAIIRAIIRFIMIIAFILAFIFLLIGGIRWITAGGDEKGVAAARGMITSALIGLVIVLVAYAIIRLVETFFGVPIISTNLEVPTIENSGGDGGGL